MRLPLAGFRQKCQKDCLINLVNNLKSEIRQNVFGKDEDLKGLAVFLASKASDYVVGQTIAVDGGQTAT